MVTQRAALYLRISKDLDGTGEATDRQEVDCLAHAERKGYDVVETFRDDDRSAYRDGGESREAFAEMMDRLGEFDVVVFWKLDRLVRRVVQFGTVIQRAEAAGTALDCVVEPLDTTTGMGKGIASMLAGIAEQESQNTSTRIKRQRDAQASKRLPVNGAKTFGYKVGGMEIEPEEAALLRDAAKRALAGDSLVSIARHWNGLGIPLPKGGQGWSVRRIAELLVAPRQAGLRVHRGEVVGDAAWPAVIDRETHERLTALARARKGRGERVKTLLSGMLVCGSCGHAMMANRTGKKEGARRKYVCRSTPQNPDACGGISIVSEPAEEWIAEAVLHRLSSGALATALEQVSTEDGEVAAATDALTAAETHLNNLAAMFGAGELSKAEWLTAREAAQDRASAARALVERVSGSEPLAGLPEDVEGLRAWWDDGATSDAMRRAVLSSVLVEVEVAPMPATGPRRFRGERLTPTWRL